MPSTPNTAQTLSLFGNDNPWLPLDWTSSDDRVRGGSSQSYLDCDPSSPTAVFYGTLDIKTLGGAGFASQRTTGEDRVWDLSDYDGLLLDIAKSDDKQYTLTLKDELLPKSPNGREQSTVSWEYDFRGEATDASQQVFVAWHEMRPTYRGREKDDTKPLDLKNIKRVSLMMRSFFGTQEGPFSITIKSISATKSHLSLEGSNRLYGDLGMQESSQNILHEKTSTTSQPKQQGLLGLVFGSCIVS